MATPRNFEQVAKVLTDPRSNSRQYRIFHFGYCTQCAKITQYRGDYGLEGYWEMCVACRIISASRDGKYLTENEAPHQLRTILKKLHSREMQIVFFLQALEEKRREVEKDLEDIGHILRQFNGRGVSRSSVFAYHSGWGKGMNSGLVARAKLGFLRTEVRFPDAFEIEKQQRFGRLQPQTNIQIERVVNERLFDLCSFQVFMRHRNYRFTSLGRITLYGKELVSFGQFLDRFSRENDVILYSYSDPERDTKIIEAWSMRYGHLLAALHLLRGDAKLLDEISKSAKTAEDFMALAAIARE